MITKIGTEVLNSAQPNQPESKKRSWVMPTVLGGTALGLGALYGLNQAGILGDPITMNDVYMKGTDALGRVSGWFRDAASNLNDKLDYDRLASTAINKSSLPNSSEYYDALFSEHGHMLPDGLHWPTGGISHIPDYILGGSN